MPESTTDPVPSAPSDRRPWLGWLAVSAAGLLVVVAAGVAGATTGGDGPRRASVGEVVPLVGGAAGTATGEARHLDVGAGLSLSVSTTTTLGADAGVLAPEGGSFVVVDVADARFRSGPSVDVAVPPAVVTLRDGDEAYALDAATDPGLPAGARAATTTAVAVGGSGTDGLVLEVERDGRVVEVDLGADELVASPATSADVRYVSTACGAVQWPSGWVGLENEYDQCRLDAHPPTPAVGPLPPAPEGSAYLAVVVDVGGTFLAAENGGRTFELGTEPDAVAYRLGDADPVDVVPAQAFTPPSRQPYAEPVDLVVFEVPADAVLDEQTFTFTATYAAEERRPDPGAPTTVEITRSTPLVDD
ncbi:hypothetical protein RDV89_13180 [Nocardioides zeae]|uniref:Uncharacterized protein n=1 Tax=Nocardioides imazamoxiresistens TaxID=3231893 RepID=A0ABU3PXZ2_9ACTN|nr:hypothetical protein [Nocardioides zeae]MDT9594029.1 hypothetical protein [Nocardioides zeae]